MGGGGGRGSKDRHCHQGEDVGGGGGLQGPSLSPRGRMGGGGGGSKHRHCHQGEEVGGGGGGGGGAPIKQTL